MNGSPSYRLVPLGLMAVAALVAACTSAPAADPSESATPTSSAPTPTRAPTTNPGPTDDEQVAELWQALHAERLAQLQSDDEPDPASFADLATEDATDAMIALISVGRGEVPLIFTNTEFWAEVEVTAAGDEATISDCMLIAQRAASRPDAEPTVTSEEWTGAATATEDGWRISDVAPGVPDCVPRELNDQLLDAYVAWHDGKNEWLDPPTPGHPLLTELMTGDGLADTQVWLEENEDLDYVIRDSHDPRANAVVTELGIGTAWVTDCYPAENGTSAAFDPATDERRSDVTPRPTPGQLDRVVVNLERTAGGAWKVAGNRSGSDASCEPRAADYVVP